MAAKEGDKRARALQAVLRRRRRHALVILAAAAALAVVASWGAARMADAHPWSQMRWMIGFGGRGGSDVATQHIATADARWFVLAVQLIPVALAGVSLLLSLPHRERERTLHAVPMWLGAALAPALAICLLGRFATHAAGPGVSPRR
ncbi:hypothetical protein [Cellulomonas timonensis]|uniref:hypothetical protein n=1 Tax=Cellulomonas timonensis TaxID=1689271 RepID=UPI00083430AD|nr:hypothetical protein [Cellulomonas timonensis]